VGVIHPGIVRFLDDYLKSLENQTLNCFDLVLFNDGCPRIECYLNKYSHLNIYIQDVENLSISKIRKLLIAAVLELGYEIIIFTDCDDMFSNQRVELSINKLQTNQIIVNDFDVVNQDGKILQKKYLSQRIEDKTIVDHGFIRYCNMMGLTNTSVKREVLLKCQPFLDVDLIAFDWFLWTIAVREVSPAIFTTDALTQYRVYDGNTAGLPQKLDQPHVIKGLAVKAKHYRQLQPFESEYYHLYKSFSEAHYNACCSNRWLNGYLDMLHEEFTDNPMWWENIKLPI